MLSVSPLQTGSSHYYANLAREDYYTKGGEPPGVWWGAGARRLGLDGEIQENHLHQLFEGFGPDGKPLVRNAGRPDRQAGLDLTFSAEKSVSVLWAFGDDATRRVIEQAHETAVRTALQYLEDEAAFSRTGQGGHEATRAGLCVGAYRHETSRAQDPNLHTHCLILNVGVDEEGVTRTLRTRDFFKHKMAAGALYRVQLAYELQQNLGVEIEAREKGFFRVKGIDEEMRRAFSTRRQAIEQALESWGMFDPAAAERATLQTRSVKGHADRPTLRERWEQHADALGLDLGSVRSIASTAPAKVRGPDRSDLERAHDLATKQLERDQAVFTLRDVIRRTAERCVDGVTSAADLLDCVRGHVVTGDRTVEVARHRDTPLYATPERCAAEGSLFRIAEQLAASGSHRTQALPVSDTLSDDQERALKYLTQESGDLANLSGIAGSGKTTLLRAAREAWERDGYRVVGATLSGKASRELHRGAGIESETFEKRRRQMEPTFGEHASHVTRQFANAAMNRRTTCMDRLRLDSKTILVVDEAAMADTQHVEFMLRQAQRAGAKVVLSGDERQLPAIEGASPFFALMQRHGAARLETIHRQRHEWMRETVRAFAEGDVASGLAILKRHDALHSAASKDAAAQQLIERWDRSRDVTAADSLILTATRSDAAKLNLLAQDRRATSGELGRRAVRLNGTDLFENDRVLFTRNDRGLGVYNGDLGTIRRVKQEGFGKSPSVRIELDGGKVVTFAADRYEHVELGYAMTTHKAQGATVDRAFVLFDDRMASREMAYVQVSRPSRQIEAFMVDHTGEQGDPERRLSRETRKKAAREYQHDLADERHGRELAR